MVHHPVPSLAVIKDRLARELAHWRTTPSTDRAVVEGVSYVRVNRTGRWVLIPLCDLADYELWTPCAPRALEMAVSL